MIGGSIYIGTCDNGCDYSISNSSFKRNTAVQFGGSIFYTQQRPKMSDLIFEQNSAKYGADRGSFGLKYLLNGTSDLSLSNVASSQIYDKPFSISIVDFDG